MLKLENIELAESIEGLLLLDEWGSKVEVRTAYVNGARKKWNETSLFPTSSV